MKIEAGKLYQLSRRYEVFAVNEGNGCLRIGSSQVLYPSDVIFIIDCGDDDSSQGPVDPKPVTLLCKHGLRYAWRTSIECEKLILV